MLAYAWYFSGTYYHKNYVGIMGLDPIIDHMRMVADHDQWVHINALNISLLSARLIFDKSLQYIEAFISNNSLHCNGAL